MNLFRDITILFLLLGSSALCYENQESAQNDGYYDNNQYSGNGLEKILNAVLSHQSTDHGQHLGSISHSSDQIIQQTKQGEYGSFQDSEYSYHEPQNKPNQDIASFGSNDGYQYHQPGSNENPKYNSQYVNSYNGNQGYEYQRPMEAQSGYEYKPPAQNYYESYHSTTNQNNGYRYDKPKQTYSNFKGHPYIPGSSTSNSDYQQGGYHYEKPIQSGYNYDKPQQSQSSFKGQSYLPLPPSSSYQNSGSSHGYLYEKPFKGQSYLPMTPVSGGW